jgi:hypothetical protein
VGAAENVVDAVEAETALVEQLLALDGLHRATRPGCSPDILHHARFSAGFM